MGEFLKIMQNSTKKKIICNPPFGGIITVTLLLLSKFNISLFLSDFLNICFANHCLCVVAIVFQLHYIVYQYTYTPMIFSIPTEKCIYFLNSPL